MAEKVFLNREMEEEKKARKQKELEEREKARQEMGKESSEDFDHSS